MYKQIIVMYEQVLKSTVTFIVITPALFFPIDMKLKITLRTDTCCINMRKFKKIAAVVTKPTVW